MKKRKVKELKASIHEKELQLAKLKGHAEQSSICSDLYNKVVLEKAILSKELKELETGSFLQKIKGIMPRKRTLICDYFKAE